MAPIGTPSLAIETPTTRERMRIAVGLLASAMLAAALLTPPAVPALPTVSIVVHERTPGSHAAEDLVQAIGGHITRPLPLIGGFAADVPAPPQPQRRPGPPGPRG